MLIVTDGVLAKRFPASTANPCRTKNPLVPVTSTESTNSSESMNGGPGVTTESPLLAGCPRETIHPLRLSPDTPPPRPRDGGDFPGPAPGAAQRAASGSLQAL